MAVPLQVMMPYLNSSSLACFAKPRTPKQISRRQEGTAGIVMQPAELARIETLIGTIYRPGESPEAVKQAQRELLVAQRSEHGWDLAYALLITSDSSAQFLGASTLTIKINDDSSPPPEDIRQQVLTWLKTAVANGYKPFVVRKIMGCVITLFFRQHSSWPSAVSDVAAVLAPNLELNLAFVQMVMEDYLRIHASLPGLRASLEAAVPEIGAWLEQGLSPQAPESIILQSLDTFLPWSSTFSQDMVPLLPSVINLLSSDDFDVFDKAAAVITDLYPMHYKAWPRKVKDQLSASLKTLTAEGDEEKHVPLGRLVLVVAEESRTPQFMPFILHSLTDTKLPLVEDDLSNETLEFWNVYVEDVIASGMSSDSNVLILEVIGYYWRRIQIHEMPQSDWEEFQSFRQDFCDFLELSYQLLGLRLFDQLVSTVLTALQERDYAKIRWTEIEASLCCLNGLADIIGFQGTEFNAVKSVFSSTLWEDLPHCQNLRVRQTAVNLIGSYDSFFETDEGRQYLAPTLSYLFESLAQSSLQNTASRSIQKLCSSSRTFLAAECNVFLAVYESLHSQLVSAAHVRVVTAIGYVIQGLSTLQEKADALNRLLTILEQHVLKPHETIEIFLDSLRCVAGLGRALQVPSDNVIEPEILAESEQFWNNDPFQLRARLWRIVKHFTPAPQPDVCETLTDIIKVGLVERLANPYCFGLDAVFTFLKTKNTLGPPDCRPPVLELAAFVITNQVVDEKLTRETVFQLLDLVGPDAHAASLQLMTSVVNSLPSGLVEYHNAPHLMEFAQGSLTFSDRFVLGSAAKFWVKFIGSGEFAPAIASLGPALVQVLMRQISGEANRSDLEYQSDVLKKLMIKHPLQTGGWLKHSVVDHPVSARIETQPIKARSDFVSQVVLLRGSRQTNQVVTKFWLLCKGIPNY